MHYYNRSFKDEVVVEYNGVISNFKIRTHSQRFDDTEYEWLIVCLKTYDFVQAHPLLTALTTSKTQILVIRNGLRHEQDFQNIVEKEKIVPAIIDCPTQKMKDNSYKHFYPPIITIPNASPSQDISNFFNPSTAKIRVVKDFKTEAWKKVIESSALGSILCLQNRTCEIFQDAEVLNLFDDLVEEGFRVAVADGAILSSEFGDQLRQKVLAYPLDKGSSMLSDRRNRRKIEIEAKNGIIVDVAKSYGIPVPINELHCSLLEEINKSVKKRQPG